VTVLLPSRGLLWTPWDVYAAAALPGLIAPCAPASARRPGVLVDAAPWAVLPSVLQPRPFADEIAASVTCITSSYLCAALTVVDAPWAAHAAALHRCPCNERVRETCSSAYGACAQSATAEQQAGRTLLILSGTGDLNSTITRPKVRSQMQRTRTWRATLSRARGSLRRRVPASGALPGYDGWTLTAVLPIASPPLQLEYCRQCCLSTGWLPPRKAAMAVPAAEALLPSAVAAPCTPCNACAMKLRHHMMLTPRLARSERSRQPTADVHSLVKHELCGTCVACA
jgi:hypothetical protein